MQYHLWIHSGSEKIKTLVFKTEEEAERAANALVGSESHGGSIIDNIACYEYIKEFGLSSFLWETEF